MAGFVKGYIPWNKGKQMSLKTKEKMSLASLIKPQTFRKGCIPWSKGKKCPILSLRLLGNTHGFKKGMTPWNKGLKGFMAGDKNYRWKGGISKDKDYDRLCRIKRRDKKHGILTLKIIQQVYEDNIKRFGTLTCYLCLKPIEFKQDCIEHKTPLSRGGTNARENLDIAHRKCNTKKYNKTEEEFRKEQIDERK